MRLRKECEHGRWEEHWTYPCPHHQGHHMNLEAFHQCQEMNKRSCPGGEFLPEGALVIEKEEGEWPEWAIIGGQTNGAGLNLTADEVIAALDSIADSYDALASQVGESER